MSNAVFPPPSAPGVVRLAWSNVRTPMFRTAIAEATSGLEAAAARWIFPRWRWLLTYHAIGEAGHELGDQLRPIVGHFLTHAGRGDTFLFQDPEDFSLANQATYPATGNGTTKHFQILRNYGGFIEPIFEVKSGTLVVKVNGVTQTAGVDYTESEGLVQFGLPLANGVAVTASCQFYFRVRFAEDAADFENFTYRLHALREVELLSKKRAA